jgi:hypothetical protein
MMANSTARTRVMSSPVGEVQMMGRKSMRFVS